MAITNVESNRNCDFGWCQPNDASTASGIDTNLARKAYTGDGSSSITVAFASLSSVGGTTYHATTTQIHREYAPTLASKANNAARFETATDGQSGAKGLLVERQSSNFLPTVRFANWTKPSVASD